MSRLSNVTAFLWFWKPPQARFTHRWYESVLPYLVSCLASSLLVAWKSTATMPAAPSTEPASQGHAWPGPPRQRRRDAQGRAAAPHDLLSGVVGVPKEVEHAPVDEHVFSGRREMLGDRLLRVPSGGERCGPHHAPHELVSHVKSQRPGHELVGVARGEDQGAGHARVEQTAHPNERQPHQTVRRRFALNPLPHVFEVLNKHVAKEEHGRQARAVNREHERLGLHRRVELTHRIGTSN
mmetsp:Transcript_63508/g.127548  ORF Transcript_63508/g.127548 Transcript_63508/m.127548 type:complete len:238 (-) Transcript_63508:143-856(-)